MTDTARAYFDAVRDLAGEPARRAREFAGRVREDLRTGTEGLRSGAEHLRDHGTRTAADLARLIRAELDANLTRIGVATQSDLDDLNLRLEHSEDQVRELRIRLAEAESRLAAAETAPQTPSAAPQSSTEERDDEEDA